MPHLGDSFACEGTAVQRLDCPADGSKVGRFQNLCNPHESAASTHGRHPAVHRAAELLKNLGTRDLMSGDPFNGMAVIEAKVLRILHNYAFYEDPSRLIRATRLAARFHWTLEERTQARYNAAKENNYIENISDRAVGHRDSSPGASRK